MKITSAEIIHIKLPMKLVFRTGFGEIRERETVLVELTSQEGVIG
ncbi:MAG: hypothetical protein ACOX6V_00850 [Patescibacteria group bacterium]|jgi:hypothetical protein